MERIKRALAVLEDDAAREIEPGEIVADVETLIRTKMTIRPSDAADRAWLESLRKGGGL